MEQGAVGQNGTGSALANEALCQEWKVMFNFVAIIVKAGGNWVEFSISKVDHVLKIGSV